MSTTNINSFIKRKLKFILSLLLFNKKTAYTIKYKPFLECVKNYIYIIMSTNLIIF